LCYYASHKTTWLQNGKLSGFKLGKRSPLNHFLTAVAKAGV
jgi:hypothetical protein